MVQHCDLSKLILSISFLTHSFPMHPFSTPWKYQKIIRCIGNEWAKVTIKILSFSFEEGAARRCFIKKVSLAILINWQENTYARVSFLIKLFKKETLVQMFSCEFCKIHKDYFFTEHLRWFLLYWQLKPLGIIVNKSDILHI